MLSQHLPSLFPILEVKAKIPTPQYVSHISGKSPGPSGQDKKSQRPNVPRSDHQIVIGGKLQTNTPTSVPFSETILWSVLHHWSEWPQWDRTEIAHDIDALWMVFTTSMSLFPTPSLHALVLPSIILPGSRPLSWVWLEEYSNLDKALHCCDWVPSEMIIHYH